MSDILRYMITAGAIAVILWLFRSRFAWLVEKVTSALFGLFLILAFFFNLGHLIRDPNPTTIFFTGFVFVLPAFLLGVMWIESIHPDRFRPVPQDRLDAFQTLINGVQAWGFPLEAAPSWRSLGMASFVFVNRSDQIIALVVGSDPQRAYHWLYSRIAGHQAVLSTANHGSGARPPGEVRQWLPGKQLPDLIEAHKKNADLLRSQGFTVGVEIDEDPLDFLRFLSEIDKQNRKRPGRYLLGVAFGDLLDPWTKPLAEQRNIERRLAQLPTRSVN